MKHIALSTSSTRACRWHSEHIRFLPLPRENHFNNGYVLSVLNFFFFWNSKERERNAPPASFKFIYTFVITVDPVTFDQNEPLNTLWLRRKWGNKWSCLFRLMRMIKTMAPGRLTLASLIQSWPLLLLATYVISTSFCHVLCSHFFIRYFSTAPWVQLVLLPRLWLW